MPAEILYEQTGLQVRKNKANGFCVIRLHYTADPAKRKPEWIKQAKAGMREADFRREYEIDYTSLFGEPVFPEMTEYEDKIVVKAPYPDFGPNQVYWGGLDYGARNPSSVHFYTIHDGVIYCVWELYHPCKDPGDFVEEVKSFPFYGNVRYIACDPSIYNKSTRNSRGLPASMAEIFYQHGLTKLVPGNTDERAWIARMRELWADSEDPRFRIFDSCTNMIREFKRAVFATMTAKAMATQNWREQILDKDNHALDDCKYFINSRPKEVKNQAVWNKAKRMVDLYI